MVEKILLENQLDGIRDELLDVQSQLVIMNSSWSENVMRSFYELKAQTKQRSQITNLFRYLVKDLQEHAETARKSDCSDLSDNPSS